MYQLHEKESNESLLEILLKPEFTSAYVPHQLTKTAKRKKVFQNDYNF